VEKGMKVESARWGDAQSITNLPAGHPPRYIVADWQAAVANVTNNIMPNRTATVLAQLRTDGLYPNLAAPAFTDIGGNPQYGGPVPSGFELRISAAAGTIYYTIDGSDPRAAGGAIAPSALTGASPISLTLNATTTVKARVFDSGTAAWSAITGAQYLVGTLGSASNLVISKLHYNPASAVDLEEFVEVMNIGANPADLTNCRFTAGIEFKFPDGYILTAGARCLIVRDFTAFHAVYPDVSAGQIAGVFANTTTLNNGGEQVQLVAADNSVIKDFVYNNNAPWPASADGLGPCLVLINPASNPDHGNPANWRASTIAGGTPGASDAISYSDWATTNNISDPTGSADDESDGLSNLEEYMLGTNPHSVTPESISTAMQTINVNAIPSEYLTITFSRAIGRDDAVMSVEASTNLSQAWAPAVQVDSPDVSGERSGDLHVPASKSKVGCGKSVPARQGHAGTVSSSSRADCADRRPDQARAPSGKTTSRPVQRTLAAV
jgi:hypothetical protein